MQNIKGCKSYNLKKNGFNQIPKHNKYTKHLLINNIHIDFKCQHVNIMNQKNVLMISTKFIFFFLRDYKETICHLFHL